MFGGGSIGGGPSIRQQGQELLGRTGGDAGDHDFQVEPGGVDTDSTTGSVEVEFKYS
jgi:hypothetical protein